MDAPPPRPPSPSQAADPGSWYVVRHRRRCRRDCFTTRHLELAFDAITAAVSAADIVTDVLVALEFYRGGYYGFLGVSLAVFVAAQLSYAFMFAANYAPSDSACKQLLAFSLVLPLAQLVPMFTWIESLHFPGVTRTMSDLGLVSSENRADAEPGHDDQLWSVIQSKYRAHAGFLLEAIIEAVPQGLLQTAFVVVYGDLTPINALSLALSLVVLCSKGWIFSYSLHRLTFCFNSLCITSDILGLFATICWLASPAARAAWAHSGINVETRGSVSLLNLTNETVDNPDSSGLAVQATRLWLYLAAVGLGLSYSGGWFLLWFSNFDDHLKLTQRREVAEALRENWTGPPIVSWIYTYRTIGWLLACLPCSIAWLTAKLAWLPIVVFKSFDPEHANHSTFYRALFHLLRTGQLPSSSDRQHSAPEQATSLSTTDRLLTINDWFVHARSARRDLTQRLATAHLRSANHLGWRQRVFEHEASSAQVADVERTVVQAWATMVGAQQRRSGNQRRSPEVDSGAEEQANLDALLLIINQGENNADHDDADDSSEDNTSANSNASQQAARVRLRRAMLAAALADRRAEADERMLARSEIIRWMRNHNPAPVRRRWLWLRWLGALCLGCSALHAVLWIVVTATFWVYSWFYPFLMLSTCFATDSGSKAPRLACALTACKGITLVGMLCLIPAVRRWQSLRLDLVGVGGFPAPFYSDATLAELLRRVTWAENNKQGANSAANSQGINRQTIDPVQAFDTCCSICLEPVLASNEEGVSHKKRVAIALPLCLHAFHQECIFQWLQSHRSCPNCRQELTRDV